MVSGIKLKRILKAKVIEDQECYLNGIADSAGTAKQRSDIKKKYPTLSSK